MCTATGGYNQCIAIDKILESFCVPCSNAVYGCPEPACSFAGTTVKLLAHLTGDHKWKSKEVKYDFKFTLPVKEGTWVFHARGHAPLFLVKFTPAPPFGYVASILCVDPHATAERRFRCRLGSSCTAIGQQQSSDFQIRSTNLSDGLLFTENDGSSLFASSTRSITVSIAKIVRDKPMYGLGVLEVMYMFIELLFRFPKHRRVSAGQGNSDVCHVGDLYVSLKEGYAEESSVLLNKEPLITLTM
uniref:SIAH-type domain-containing protein n=1 Tax=Aegilops tauschii TaxID=37682 RepID=M8BF07_AEGTA